MVRWFLRRMLISAGLLLWSAGAAGQNGWPSHVEAIHVAPSSTAEIRGALNQGTAMPDLSWASRSNVACFPSTRNPSFRGNHVFFGTRLPAYSLMEIIVVPQRGVDVNLYAYTVGVQDFSRIPPNVPRVVSCEASSNFGRSNPGKVQSVQLNALRNPYNVVIGVAGPAGVTSGRFTLKIKLTTREAEPQLTGKVQITDVQSQSGVTVAVQGDLATGQQLPLRGWADSSQVACFPATQFDKFRGHHVLFRTQLPRHSILTITAVPGGPGLDISLYALRVGARDTTTVPPKVSRAACEASLAYPTGNPGTPESVQFMAVRNPYNIVIGVAGVKGVTSGKFALKIDVQPR